MFCVVWLKFSKEQFRWGSVSKFIILSVLAVIIFTLVYEILYLGKERELANKIVDRLDVELTRAETTASRNESDPHFIFNSLSTLSHLITYDTAKADLFNNKLAEVYKYFLISKDRQLVTVEKEIGFIKNYFFLLQIWHEDKLKLHIDVTEGDLKDTWIIPCTLQVLIENTIKQNEFTVDHPIEICIKTDGKYLTNENTVKGQRAKFDSTQIGFKNLSAQYILVSNKNILAEENENRFIIKLPLIKLHKTEFV